MAEQHNISDLLWEVGWEGHEKAQMQRMSRLSLIEKIKWLEEAQEVVDKLKSQSGKE